MEEPAARREVTRDAAWLASLVRAAPSRTARTRVVAVDGPSGAGKSTVAGLLSRALACHVVHMDDLYPGWEGLAEAVPRLVDWVLEPLRDGAVARYQRYDWTVGAYAEWHEVPGCDVLVVEGVGSGARAAAPYLSMIVWVEAPTPVRMRRGVERDGEAYRPHWERWARQEQVMFAQERTRERADVLVDGAGDTPRVQRLREGTTGP